MAKYRGMGPNLNKAVPRNEALDYACHECGVRFTGAPTPLQEEAKQAFEEWFFSGAWILEGDEDGSER